MHLFLAPLTHQQRSPVDIASCLPGSSFESATSGQLLVCADWLTVLCEQLQKLKNEPQGGCTVSCVTCVGEFNHVVGGVCVCDCRYDDGELDQERVLLT